MEFRYSKAVQFFSILLSIMDRKAQTQKTEH